MSYLALGGPLPAGTYISRPDVIYRDYAAYRQSPDFIQFELTKVHTEWPHSRGPKLADAKYPVHVYKNNSSFHVIGVIGYDLNKSLPTLRGPRDREREVPKEEQEQNRLAQDVSGQFTLPCIHQLGFFYSETTLREFLCSILAPGSKAELYRCFALNESAERDKTRDQVVNLPGITEDGDPAALSHEYTHTGQFVTYCAPVSGEHWFPHYEYIQQDGPVITVIADKQEAYLPFAMAFGMPRESRADMYYM